MLKKAFLFLTLFIASPIICMQASDVEMPESNTARSLGMSIEEYLKFLESHHLTHEQIIIFLNDPKAFNDRLNIINKNNNCFSFIEKQVINFDKILFNDSIYNQRLHKIILNYDIQDKATFIKSLLKHAIKHNLNHEIKAALAVALSSTNIELDYSDSDSEMEESKDISQPEICSICLEEFDTDNETHTTNCNHRYHSGCLMNWLKTKTPVHFAEVPFYLNK